MEAPELSDFESTAGLTRAQPEAHDPTVLPNYCDRPPEGGTPNPEPAIARSGVWSPAFRRNGGSGAIRVRINLPLA